jgi:quinol monooxygenase YgiN
MLDHDETMIRRSEDEVELTMVTMTFDAADEAALLAILSKYVVLTRMQDGCRNVDLCSSVTRPGRHLVVQKWETPQHQRVHFDSDVMVDMASACVGVLSSGARHRPVGRDERARPALTRPEGPSVRIR